MRRSGLNTINAAFFFFVSIGSLTDCAISGAAPWEYVLHTAPFLFGAAILYALKKKIGPKITAIMYLALGALSILFSEHDSLTGAIFMCYAFCVLEKRWVAITAALASALALLYKATSTPFTPPQTIVYIAGFAHIVAVFWWLVLRRPVAVALSPGDYETAEIIRMRINGLTYKEIADRMCLSDSAISKRLERARRKVGAHSNEHLVALMSRSGQLVLE